MEASPGTGLFAAAVGFIVRADRSERSLAIATALWGLSGRARNLASLLNAHAAGHDFTAIGALGHEQRWFIRTHFLPDHLLSGLIHQWQTERPFFGGGGLAGLETLPCIRDVGLWGHGLNLRFGRGCPHWSDKQLTRQDQEEDKREKREQAAHLVITHGKPFTVSSGPQDRYKFGMKSSFVQQGISRAGSQKSGPITGGRIYLEEGSCAPFGEVKAGPPGRPGSPFPTVPNDLRSLELPAVPTVGAAVGCVPGALGVTPPAPVMTGCKAG